MKTYHCLWWVLLLLWPISTVVGQDCYLDVEVNVVQHYQNGQGGTFDVNINDIYTGDVTVTITHLGASKVGQLGENPAPTPGVYRISVVDQNWCTGYGLVYVHDVDALNTVCVTEGTCLLLGDLSTEAPGYCAGWYEGENVDLSAEVLGNNTEVCPTDNTFYLKISTDANGDVQLPADLYYIVVQEALEIAQTPDFACAPTTVTLSVPNTYSNYQWNTGGMMPTTQVAIPDDFTVTVVDDEGCSQTARLDRDMADNADLIFEQLVDNGFFYLPIDILTTSAVDCSPLPLVSTTNATSTYLLSSETFNFSGYSLDLSTVDIYTNLNTNVERIRGVNNFFSAANFVTNNEVLCSCPDAYANIENQFLSSSISVWTHIWENPDGSGEDVVFYKFKDLDPVEHNFIDLLLDNSADIEIPDCAFIHPTLARPSKFVYTSGLHDIELIDDADPILDYANLYDSSFRILEDATSLSTTDLSGYEIKTIISATGTTVNHPTAGIVESAILAKEKYENNNTTPIVIWTHFTPGGRASYCIKINESYFDDCPPDDLEFNRADFRKILVESIYTLTSIPQETFFSDLGCRNPIYDMQNNPGECPWYLGPRPRWKDDYAGTYAYFIAYNTLTIPIEIFRNGRLSDRYWKQDGYSFWDLPGGLFGVVEAIAEENPLVAVYQITHLFINAYVGLLEELYSKGLIQMEEGVLSVGKKIYRKFISDLNHSDPETRFYHQGKVTTQAFFAIASLGTLAWDNIAKRFGKTTDNLVSSLDDLLKELPRDQASGFYKKLDHYVKTKAETDEFLHFLGRIEQAHWDKLIDQPNLIGLWQKAKGDASINLTEIFQNFPRNNQAFYDNFFEVLIEVNSSTGKTIFNSKTIPFVKDIQESMAFYDYILANPEKCKIWSVLSESTDGVAAIIRRQPDNLDIVDEYLFEYPTRTSSVKDNFNGAFDKQQYIDDLLGPGLPGDIVRHRVRGLKERINVTDNLNGILSDNPNAAPNFRETIVMASPGKEDNGFFIRGYYPNQNMFIFYAGFRHDAPTWLDNGQVPLIEGKGIPTQMLVTLRQMKMLNIPNESLKIAKMSTIQNLETLLWLGKHKLENGWTNVADVGADILKAPQESIGYATDVLKQASYRVRSASLDGTSATEITFADLRDNFPSDSNLGKITQADLDRYGLSWTDKTFIDFDIFLDLKAF